MSSPPSATTIRFTLATSAAVIVSATIASATAGGGTTLSLALNGGVAVALGAMYSFDVQGPPGGSVQVTVPSGTLTYLRATLLRGAR